MTRFCGECGYENLNEAVFCKKCGNDLRVDRPPPPPRMTGPQPAKVARPVKYEKPHVELPKRLAQGGVLLVVAGVIGMLLGAVALPGLGSSGLSSWVESSGTIPIWLSLFALIGGILALLRRVFYFALALAILGCFAVGPYFLSSLFATIGAILLAVSRRDFIPIYATKPPQTVKCPVCKRPLEYAPLYKEWYCYNCKSYKEFEPPAAVD